MGLPYKGRNKQIGDSPESRLLLVLLEKITTIQNQVNSAGSSFNKADKTGGVSQITETIAHPNIGTLSGDTQTVINTAIDILIATLATITEVDLKDQNILNLANTYTDDEAIILQDNIDAEANTRSLEDINLQTQITNLFSEANVTIGRIQKTNTEVTADTGLLTTFTIANTSPSRSPLNNDRILDLDNHIWIYTSASSSWIDGGIDTVALATTVTVGIVKLATIISLGNNDVTTSELVYNELLTKEPVFSKLTAFNKDFETVSSNIKMDGIQDIGVSNNVPRADHTHPTDTSRAADIDVVHKNGSETITGLKTFNILPQSSIAPINTNDLTNKAYVDSAAVGLDPHPSVRVITTTNIASLSGLLVIDGVLLNNNDRVGVIFQTLPAQNGIYLASSGAWPRASDADINGEIKNGTSILSTEGNSLGGSGWQVVSTVPIVIGTTPINWIQTSMAGQYTAGTGLDKVGHVFSISDQITPGIFTKVTTNAQGQVIYGDVLIADDIPNLDWSKINSGKPTTLSGYGITDAATTAQGVKADNAIQKDGSVLMTANLDINNYKLINLLSGSVNTDAVNKGQMDTAIASGNLFKDSFNASTGLDRLGNPLPVPGVANNGFKYVCSVAGTFYSETYIIGEYTQSNGTTWVRISGGTQVTSNNVIESNALANIGTAANATQQSINTGINTNLGTRALDTSVVHISGTETITGTKTFNNIASIEMSGNIDMNSHIISELTPGTADTDAANITQTRQNPFVCGASYGVVNFNTLVTPGIWGTNDLTGGNTPPAGVSGPSNGNMQIVVFRAPSTNQVTQMALPRGHSATPQIWMRNTIDALAGTPVWSPWVLMSRPPRPVRIYQSGNITGTMSSGAITLPAWMTQTQQNLNNATEPIRLKWFIYDGVGGSNEESQVLYQAGNSGSWMQMVMEMANGLKIVCQYTLSSAGGFQVQAYTRTNGTASAYLKVEVYA